MLCMAVGITANVMALKFARDSQAQMRATLVGAEGFRARQIALGGFQAGLAALKTIPEEFLYSTGIALEPPDILVSDDCKPKCFITYRIIPEDGKLNLNNLILWQEDKPNDQYRIILERLFRQYDIPVDSVINIMDWLDENTTGMAENHYYESLKPPVKIKNYYMFSLSELGSVKDIKYEYIYHSRAPENWAAQRAELAFLTEEEKTMIQEPDWILANNLTAYVPYGEQLNDKVNINAARYHVLMSLSESMTERAVKALFKYRKDKGNYIKNIDEIRSLPEFQTETPLGVTLYEELAGSGPGGQVSGMIKSEGEIYRVVGVGSIVPEADNSRKNPVVRRVTGLYDKVNSRLIYYSED